MMLDNDVADDLRRTFSAALTNDDPPAARAALVAAGWLDVLEADTTLAVAIVFREQGRTGRDAAALDDVLATHLGTGDAAVAYPAAPGMRVFLPAHAGASHLIWLPDLTGDGLALVELAEPLRGQPVAGIDPGAGLIGLVERPAGSVSPLSRSAWPAALAAGRIALAQQMVAGTRELLGLATRYAQDRRQFGSPIGTFQAVKHRLADTLVAVSAAEAAVAAAAVTQTESGAAIAKALAGRAVDVAGRNCLQVFGGIGFTTEHPFHHYYRRGIVLDRLLGDRRSLERQLGRALRSGHLSGEHVVELDHTPRIELL